MHPRGWSGLEEQHMQQLRPCLAPFLLGVEQEEPAKEDRAFGVSPGSGMLEARALNAPPTSIPLQVFFNPR